MNQQDNDDAEGHYQEEEEDRFSVFAEDSEKELGEKQNRRKDVVKRSKVQVPTTTWQEVKSREK